MDLNAGRFMLLNEKGGAWFQYPKFSLYGLICEYAKNNALKELPKEITKLRGAKNEMTCDYLNFTVGELMSLMEEKDFDRGYYCELKVPEKIVQKHITVLLEENLEESKLSPKGLLNHASLKEELLLGKIKVEDYKLMWQPKETETTESKD